MIYDVAIIGGGLAGLVSAIELSRAGLSVLLVEKKEYPFHRVCGEYISNEVLPYLQSLGFDPFAFGAKKISRFELTAVSGVKAATELPLGGFGLSRYLFDEQLYLLALSQGVHFQLNDSVEQVILQKNEDLYELKTQKDKLFKAKLIIGAQGKRSLIDKTLNRKFITQRSSYMGVKCHYEGDFPEDLVALHNFKGGYCGLSMVETGHINVCYLSSDANLKRYKDIKTMERELLSQNPHLKKVFSEWKPVFKNALTISQIYFHEKELSTNGILMAGDAAGLIYPLCGNGMAMAIHAAKLLSEQVIRFFKTEIDRKGLEQGYSRIWKENFSTRIKAGGFLQNFFGAPLVSGTAVRTLKVFPFLTKAVIRFTHGKKIELL